MENFRWMPSLPTWLVALGLLLLFYCRQRQHHHRGRRLKLPPGPKPWPIIGNLNLIGSLPHRSLHCLSSRFGPLMYLRLGSIPALVASSVDTAEAILKTHDLSFVSRPKNSAGRYTMYDYSDLLWAPYGTYWRQARKIFIVELFSAKRIDQFEYIRVEEMKSFLKNLYESSGRPIELRENLMDFSLSVISRMGLGKNYLDDKTEPSGKSIMRRDEFKEMIHEFFFLNGVLDIGDSIPWLRCLDLQGNIKRMKALSKKLDGFLEHLVNEHDERRGGADNYVARDVLDVLLQLADDPNLEVKLERDGIKALILDLLLGGTDTISITVEWVFTELLRKPEILQKATSELDDVIGKSRWVNEDDTPNLPYLDAIIKETMRLHPVGPLLSPRLSHEHCKVSGFDIPAGTRVFVNVWAIGRDPSVWGDAEVFRPERFVGRSVDVTGHNFELLPFGAGRRMCPAYNLGLKEIRTAVANLLHGFGWKLPNGMKEEDLNTEEVFGLTTHKKLPLVTIIEPRLPASLYMP